MDFFRGVGNWFKGAFSGESEEEKRRKQQQQKPKQQAPKPKPAQNNQVQGINPLSSRKTDPFAVEPKKQTAPKPTPKPAPKPTIVAKPEPLKIAEVPKAPTVRPQADYKFTPDEAQKMNAGFKQGKITKEQYNDYSKKAAAQAKKQQTNGKVHAGHVTGAIGDTVAGVIQGALRTPETLIRSVAQPLGDAMGFEASQQEENTGLRRTLYGKAPVKTYIDEAKGWVEEGKKSENATVRTLAPYAIFAAPLVAGLDLMPGGKAKTEALETIVKRTLQEEEKRLGRKLTEEEFNTVSQTVRSQAPANTDRTNRINQREADQALQNNSQREKADLNTPPSDRERTPVAPEPTDVPAFQNRQAIQEVIQREEANFERFVNENPDLTPAQIDAARQAAKDRVVKLTDELKESRRATEEAVEAQADDIAKQTAEQQQTVEDVVKQQEENRAFGEAETVTPTPEVDANDAYTDAFSMTDKVLEKAGVDTTVKDRKLTGVKKFFHKATGGFISDPYKDLVDKIRDTVADLSYKATSSTNTFTNSLNRPLLLFGNNAVIKDGTKQLLRVRNDAQTAAGDAVKRLHDNLSEKISQLPDAQGFNQRLDQFFESPDFLARRYGDGTPKITLDDLPPAEREIAETLIEMNKMRNRALYNQGKISPEEYQMFSNGMHSPRLYDFEKLGTKGRGNNLIDNTATKKRNKLEDISDETFAQLIESPAQRMLIRLEMALRSQASHDALKALDDAGMVVSRPPNNQFSKLEGAKWGEFEGRYVFNPIKGQLGDEIVMNTQAGRSFNDLLDQYRDSPFGKADRFMKKTKTVYSPGTFIGNVLSNPLMFNRGAGVNPFTQSARMAKAGVDLVRHRTGKTFDKDIYEAQRYGVFSSDTGKQMTGENNPELSVTKGDKNIAQKTAGAFESTYGGADDAAKLAIWRALRNRGVDPETAARRVAQFTQDYNNAGRLVRTLADMPVIGKPFARFVPELVRLTKNNMMYNPVGMVAGVAGIAMLQKELSEESGESPEEREARETAVGQTLIPGTAWINKALTGTDRDISLNFPVNDSAINIARAVGMNFPQDTSGDPYESLIKSLTPWAIPTRDNAQGETVFAPEELFTSLAWSPIAQQVFNRDFMGREISDPTNKARFERNGQIIDSKFENPDGSRQSPGEGAEWDNRLRHLFMSYVPLANESNAVYSANRKEDDYYGKERTIPESIARAFGFKVEGNSEEKQQERVQTEKYFEEDLAAVQGFLKTNPDLQDAYLKLKNTSRNRFDNISTNNLVTPEKWDIINSDTSGRLFNFLKAQAVKQNEEEAKPLDPIFELSDENAKYVAELRSRPSGDDIEAMEILRATSEWYGQYEDAYHDYLNRNNEYFKNQPQFEGGATTNPRVKEYGEISAPVPQPDIIKEYFKIKDADPERAKEVYKANADALSTAFEKYAKDRLERINKLRKIEGYEPISLETFTNKSFGFDPKATADSGGWGFGGGKGGGRGGSDPEPYGNTLGELTSFSNDIKGLDVEAQVAEMPDLQRLFAALQAGQGGGRQKPRLGASSRGQ